MNNYLKAKNELDVILTRQKNINLEGFVAVACKNKNTNVDEILNKFLSVEDKEDILAGNCPLEALGIAIELWIKGDKRHVSTLPLEE